MTKNVKKTMPLVEAQASAKEEKRSSEEEIRSSALYQELVETNSEDTAWLIAEIEKTGEQVRSRAHAFAVRAQILDFQRVMEKDPRHPLCILQNKKNELDKLVSAAIVIGGVEVPPPPAQSELRKVIYELQKKINALKNKMGEEIATREGVKQDEIFALYRAEHPEVANIGKSINQNTKKE